MRYSFGFIYVLYHLFEYENGFDHYKNTFRNFFEEKMQTLKQISINQIIREITRIGYDEKYNLDGSISA